MARNYPLRGAISLQTFCRKGLFLFSWHLAPSEPLGGSSLGFPCCSNCTGFDRFQRQRIPSHHSSRVITTSNYRESNLTVCFNLVIVICLHIMDWINYFALMEHSNCPLIAIHCFCSAELLRDPCARFHGNCIDHLLNHCCCHLQCSWHSF